MYHHDDYVTILKEELTKRVDRNPRYSLRAFARDIRVSPARLSEVLNRKYHLSRAAATHVVESLGYSPKERGFFENLVQWQAATSPDVRAKAKIRLARYRQNAEVIAVAQDQFHLIADWYHFAILELMTLKRFKSSVEWIAEELEIRPKEVTEALDRLERMGFITRKGRAIRAVTERSASGNDTPSDAVKRFHQQVLERSAQALHLQPVTEREFHATILSLDTAELPDAKALIRDFHQDFCAKTQQEKAKEHVYCLAVQLFKMSSGQHPS